MPISPEEVAKVVAHSRATLSLAYDATVDENTDLYHSIPLCVVDALFSINSNSHSTFNTVQRLAISLGLPLKRAESTVPEYTISDLLALYEQMGVERMVDELYRNRQRTSVTNGILKAEAVQRVCEVLQGFGVENWATIEPVFRNPAIESAIREIPGQKSGISFRAFCLLLGNDDYIKPDRMLVRFVHTAMGREPSISLCEAMIRAACHVLRADFPHLTPASFDARIWRYQRS